MVGCITFVGLKHSGKSSISRLLSNSLKRPCYDADSLLERFYCARYGQKLSFRAIYRALGKDGFDTLQFDVLKGFFTQHSVERNSILSLGGGAADVEPIGPLLRARNCFIVLLEEELSLLFDRIVDSGLPPFLQSSAELQSNFQSAFEKFCQLSEVRLQRYRAWAHITLQCGGRKPKVLATELQNHLELFSKV